MNKYEKYYNQLTLCAIQHATFMEYEERHIFRTVKGEAIGKPNYLALQSIKQLVELATPKKLYDNFFCPNCNKIKVDYSYNFCPGCGQALDWSDK